VWFLLFWALSVAAFFWPLSRLVVLSVHDERYSHVVLIPLISLGLIYSERRRIFREPRYCPSVGTFLLLPGIVLYFVVEAWSSSLNQNDRLSLTVFAIVSLWIAGFVLCYGTRSFRTAVFPLFFLLLMIPMPEAVLDKCIFALQKGSAETTYALFKLFGVPVFWQGFKFSLPGIEIEIAKECSGIRSTLALFITGMLAGHVFLQSGWRKIVLTLSTIPIAIFKNAVRIVTLSSLGVYVDRGFLFGRLHHQGGLLFALIALAIFVPLLFALQKSESRAQTEPLGQVQDDPLATESVGVL
jgi:exosortase